MKATMEKLSSNKVRLDFVVEAERFEKAMQVSYKKNVGRINVPGFRKGKAPRKVIERMYGETIFYEDAIDELFPSVYSEAIQEHKIVPVDRPEFELKEIGAGKDLEFSVEVFVKPDVTLGQYKGLEAEKAAVDVTEDDVNAEIERARERVSRYIDVEDRAAKLDDQVNIDYAGYVDGEAFEGGTAQGQNLVLGSGTFIPGFEDQLVGKNVGEEVDVNVTFPEEYHAENLKGKPAVFKVKINSIQEKDVPALDDEFAKDVSECETFEEYKNKTREDLVKRAEDRADAEFENTVIEKAVENAQVDIPAAMIEDRISQMLGEMEMRMRYQGIDMEMYYKYTGQTEETLRDSMRESAEREVKTRLVLEAIRDAEAMEATDEEIDKEIEKYVERTQGDLAKFKENLTEDDKSYFASAVKMQKTVDLMKNSAVAPAADKE